jgi:hypothetical protein
VRGIGGLLAVALTTLLIACGSGPASGSNSSGSPVASAVRATPVTTVAPVVDQSPCQIPIAPAGNSAAAGFVRYPDGTFTPAGAAIQSPAQPGAPDGGFGLTYDRRFTKWLPVPPNWVAPDGSRYAYGTLRSMNNPNPTNLSLHVVDVATGSEQSVAPGDWSVVAFNAAGVYVMKQSATAAPSGLSVIDPDTGSVRQITDAGSWTLVAGGAAWGTQAQQPGHPELRLDHLYKLDVASSQLSDSWLVRPGMSIYALGDDSRGSVIVQATGGPSEALEFWLVNQQSGNATQIYTGSTVGQLSLNSVYALGDSHGVWFGTQSGLYLYSDGGAVVKVANNPGQVAGTCS